MIGRFNSVVLIPVGVVVGMIFGLQLGGQHLPDEILMQVMSVMLGTWIGLFMVELISNMLSDAVLKALNYDEPEEGAKGELTILLVRDGDVVGQMRSWDKPLPKQQAEYWVKKIGKLLTRAAAQAQGKRA